MQQNTTSMALLYSPSFDSCT